MIKRYMCFNIGCIECGVSSGVVGFYDSMEEAQQVADKLDKHLDWRQGGQNNYEVFDLLAEPSSEYAEALNGN